MFYSMGLASPSLKANNYNIQQPLTRYLNKEKNFFNQYQNSAQNSDLLTEKYCSAPKYVYFSSLNFEPQEEYKMSKLHNLKENSKKNSDSKLHLSKLQIKSILLHFFIYLASQFHKNEFNHSYNECNTANNLACNSILARRTSAYLNAMNCLNDTTIKVNFFFNFNF